MHQAIHGLFYALEHTFAASLENAPKRIGFMRAELHPRLPETLGCHTLYCSQSFKPEYDKLAQTGIAVSPTLTADSPTANSTLDLVVYLPTRNREENKYMVAKGTEMLKDGGVFITAQHNTLGAKQYEKDIQKLLPDVTTTSKNHCRLIQANKTHPPDNKLYERYLAHGQPELVQNTRMHTLPGLFSGKRPDAGSQLLVDMIEQEDLSGRGADFGAGWGFLSHRVLKMSLRIQEMHLFEAEQRALQCAEANISTLMQNTKIKTNNVFYHWSDLPNETFEPRFDFILCNPPQHSVSKADTSLVRQFIEQCGASLKPDGVLWLVTNQQIPAKKLLASYIGDTELKSQDKQYAVFRAIKRAH